MSVKILKERFGEKRANDIIGILLVAPKRITRYTMKSYLEESFPDYDLSDDDTKKLMKEVGRLYSARL